MVDCKNNTSPPLMLDVHEAEQHKAVGSRESQTEVRFCCVLAGISGPWTATRAGQTLSALNHIMSIIWPDH